ncbi:hypothetical protein SAICODRAFT_30130 [Saitoella complicata NRRL Y-17804]|uniref:Uncharacterized protein n=1 Tax=Saitoella complicata (strain BCRC 22490 / CBS 7301 / JCM 7358 / NBRC 10748 / NRRL Y-17804) TaxID=698492 RepID=A0A0E9NRA7_SAICN|nr:uncharacterized protein SAICODRAFT_30130 [Saitoella complicata NRRL Y-17804]ODQ53434.1 hypothetical protein SAICODRAFT_30130 [Saitoella complicata NRRL Y-17804]GAO52387.1 hypothetical protein G7K_6465-t1 [Saitoella complicata NRRL Y-17804]
MSAPAAATNAVSAVQAFALSYALGSAPLDAANDTWNTYAEETIPQSDPFSTPLSQLTLPKSHQRLLKSARKMAYRLDDLNVGALLCCFPVVGPLITFTLQSRIVTHASDAGAPAVEVVGRMHANITFDLLITFWLPVVGAWFQWRRGSATKNVALLEGWMRKNLERRREVKQGGWYEVDGSSYGVVQQPKRVVNIPFTGRKGGQVDGEV